MMYYAHNFKASFQFSVNEAATATCTRRSRSQTRAYYRRKAAATGPVIEEDIEMSYVEEEEEEETATPHAAKRVCRPETRGASATALWYASNIDRILDQEREMVRNFLNSRCAVVSLLGPGVNLSFTLEVNSQNYARMARIVEELRGLSVGGSPGGRSSTLKRSFGEI